MSHPTWRRWRGWLVGVLIFLIGVSLILSDRVAARSPARPWIKLPGASQGFYSYEPPDPLPGEPWPQLISQMVFPRVNFEYTKTGSYFGNIVTWIQGQASIRFIVNWHALADVGITDQSTLFFTGTNVPLPDLLNALIKEASEKSPAKPKLAWEAQSNRVIYLTTAKDLEEEHQCQIQRQKEAPPPLRQALDRQIPYVKLRELTIPEALNYCQRVSGVKIQIQDDVHDRSGEIDVITENISFEHLLELILHSAGGSSPGAWHFKVHGEGLVVYRIEGEK